MPHVVLLGDSILDNGAYVRSGPTVIDQVRGLLPEGWRATLLAVDGSLASHVVGQLAGLPDDATHLVISAGGNNALLHASIAGDTEATSANAVLRQLAEVAELFEEGYRAMLEAALVRGLPTALCTIYNPNMPDPASQRELVAGLMVFNDVILRTAFRFGLPVIDLRLVCDSPADFANPIEPSSAGGAKIAAQIVAVVTSAEGDRRRTQVYW